MGEPRDPVLVGRVVRPRGMKGEVIVEPLTDNSARFAPGEELWIDGRRRRVATARPQGDRWVVGFQDVRDRDGAEALRGAELLIEAAELGPLPGHRYYVHELVGCRILRPDGTVVGTVRDVIPGPRDWLEVESPERTTLVPMVRSWLREVDLGARRIVLDTPAGLIEESAADGGETRADAS